LRRVFSFITLGLLAAGLHARPAAAQATIAEAQAAIKHVIIIMQENRSFDSYFGTYPGAEGIPMDANGQPTACYPSNIQGAPCIVPFHDRHGVNVGGLHSLKASIADIDGGKMDGWIAPQQTSDLNTCTPQTTGRTTCAPIVQGYLRNDAAGYHTADELPNYWGYASRFVLQDHMFEPVASYSLPAHLYMTSGWEALCTSTTNPMSCKTGDVAITTAHSGVFAWSDLTDLLDRNKITWKYYLEQGTEPDCDDDAATCPPEPQQAAVLSWFNPIPGFGEILSKNKVVPTYLAQHNPPIEQFYADLKNRTLPTVSWIVPSMVDSEHAPADIQHGMLYVTSLINAVMASPYWYNTVIFLAWDDWGGFADHVVPPVSNTWSGLRVGYGIRVPAMIISPFSKAGTIDHQVMSFDAYLRFIEDLFLSGQRIGGLNGARPDSRPVIRETLATVQSGVPGSTDTYPVGSLLNDLSFTQRKIAPFAFPVAIPVSFQPTYTTANASVFPLTWWAVTAAKIATYTVKRTTTSGSGYVPVTGCSPTATKAFLATKCTDKTALHGVTYHYVVTSTDANGVESANSTEVDVTP
jgi:phospholipase C